MRFDSIETVLTAAGESESKFIPAGFGVPKNLIHFQGNHVLGHAIESYAVNQDKTTVAVNASEEQHWSVSTRLKKRYPSVNFSVVPDDAQGALASAMFAWQGNADAPIVVAAGDSFIREGISSHIAQFLESGVEGGTIVFPANAERWSYISSDDGETVDQVAEKRVIGQLATTGVFYFRKAQHFLDAAEWAFVNNATLSNVFFVSTTLNHLIMRGLRVGFRQIPRESYVSLSLPVDFAGDSLQP